MTVWRVSMVALALSLGNPAWACANNMKDDKKHADGAQPRSAAVEAPAEEAAPADAETAEVPKSAEEAGPDVDAPAKSGVEAHGGGFDIGCSVVGMGTVGGLAWMVTAGLLLGRRRSSAESELAG